jgi:hypothetical protein
MRAGLAGIYANYRNQEIKGVKYGEVDIIFEGDTHFPTESRSVKVLDTALCRVLIDALADARKAQKSLFISCVAWIDFQAKEPSITMLTVLGMDYRGS